MTESHGIILKTFFEKKRTLVMLDRTHGKIVCSSTKEPLCVGGLMKYYLQKNSYTYVAHAIEYIGLPCHLNKDDLLFFHAVLEICYYFIPLDSNALEVFQYIQHLSLHDTYSFSYQYRILFLVKLLVLLGIQPEITKGRYPELSRLFSRDIDSIILDSIDLTLIDEMLGWLHHCLSLHPLRLQFKTLHFLKKQE
jgi:hypothetical protein